MIQSPVKQAQKNMPSQHKEAGMISNVHHSTDNKDKKQPPETFDQFLISCSDDGSINIYDVSSFAKSSIDEFYT